MAKKMKPTELLSMKMSPAPAPMMDEPMEEPGGEMDFSEYIGDLQSADVGTLAEMIVEIAGAYMTEEEFNAMLDDFGIGMAEDQEDEMDYATEDEEGV